MINYYIEQAYESDVDSISAIMRETEKKLPDQRYYVMDDDVFIKAHIREKGFILVAKSKNETIGFLIVRFPMNEHDNLGNDIGLSSMELSFVAHMESVAVLPEFRGNGIQRALLSAAEKMLKMRGYKYMMATVFPLNTVSVSNFEKMDYSIVDTKVKYNGLQRHIFLKKLDEQING